jgi:hypothetical protein
VPRLKSCPKLLQADSLPQEIEADKRSGVTVELVDGKLTHMVGTIHGT